MTKANKKAKRLIGLFLLGILLFNYPIIALFNLKKLVLGLPLLFVYMFAVWSGFILLIFIITTPFTTGRSKLSDNGEDQ